MIAVAPNASLEVVELRQQAHFWRALHARAQRREESLRTEIRELTEQLRKTKAALAAVECENAALRAAGLEKDGQLEALKARVAWLTRRLFGRQTEQKHAEPAQQAADAASGDQEIATPAGVADGQEGATVAGAADVPRARPRGQQPGAQGHGRQRRTGLPTVEEFHGIPGEQACCSRCGMPFAPFPGTDDSEELEWEVLVRRRIHRRRRYRRTCQCPQTPVLVSAPTPPKVVPKGLFGVSFWVRLLLEKYLFQRPLHRILSMLRLEGLSLSQGTVTGGLQEIAVLLQPVFARILERNRQSTRWKMDETRWQVFAEIEGKTGYRWWLWVPITADTVVYLLEPARSAEVVRGHLGKAATGIILADRYKVYRALGPGIGVAFCWSHIRRDFTDLEVAYPQVRVWAALWVQRIGELFASNDRRVAVLSQPEEFAIRDLAVREAVLAMEHRRERELSEAGLHSAARKALESLRRHWQGATLFVEHPEIPMDNNEAERRLRDPVTGRKNYYGCGSLWSGQLLAMAFTIFQSLLKNRLDPQRRLSAYLWACARNGGRAPPEVDVFLPWNLSAEEREAWRISKHPP